IDGFAMKVGNARNRVSVRIEGVLNLPPDFADVEGVFDSEGVPYRNLAEENRQHQEWLDRSRYEEEGYRMFLESLANQTVYDEPPPTCTFCGRYPCRCEDHG